MTKDTTGPAFPSPYSNVENQGLTKREWFAGLALQALLSKENTSGTEHAYACIALTCAEAFFMANKAALWAQNGGQL